MTNKPKSPKTGTAPARAPSVKARYLTAGTFYRMGLHEVVTALKVIEEEGRPGNLSSSGETQQGVH